MDDVFFRTSHIAVAIFAEVDNKTLADCNIVSENWGSFIDMKKVKWLRIILKYAENMTKFANHWKVLLRRTSVKIVQEIALTVEEFFSVYPKRKDYQWSPFVIGADGGDLELYQYISNKLNQKDLVQVDQTKSLAFATMSGHLECCKFILANLTEESLWKAIMFSLLWAARYGHLEIFMLLIENTSDKNHLWNLGWSPLHEAASGGCLNSIYSAIEHNGAMPIDIAAKNGHLKICEFLITNIVDKNPSHNVDGTTALHVAARFNQLDACKLIMHNVSDKNPRNHSGQTPLHFAARAGHMEICRLLIDSVEDKNPENNLSWTPLGEAVFSGHLQVVKLIISNIQEVVDKEVLAEIAVENSDFGLCEFLIDGEKGSNCNPISQLFFFTLLSIMFPLQFIIHSKCLKWRIYGFFVHFLLSTFAFFALYLNVTICLSPVRGVERVWDGMTFLTFQGFFTFFLIWVMFFAPMLQSISKRMKGL